MYNAFTAPYQTNTSRPRGLVGMVKQGTVNSGVTGSWSTLNRGATRNAQDCTAVDTYRENLVQGITPNPAPDPPTSCPANSTFGNSDIYSFSNAP